LRDQLQALTTPAFRPSNRDFPEPDAQSPVVSPRYTVPIDLRYTHCALIRTDIFSAIFQVADEMLLASHSAMEENESLRERLKASFSWSGDISPPRYACPRSSHRWRQGHRILPPRQADPASLHSHQRCWAWPALLSRRLACRGCSMSPPAARCLRRGRQKSSSSGMHAAQLARLYCGVCVSV